MPGQGFPWPHRLCRLTPDQSTISRLMGSLIFRIHAVVLLTLIYLEPIDAPAALPHASVLLLITLRHRNAVPSAVLPPSPSRPRLLFLPPHRSFHLSPAPRYLFDLPRCLFLRPTYDLVHPCVKTPQESLGRRGSIASTFPRSKRPNSLPATSAVTPS